MYSAAFIWAWYAALLVAGAAACALTAASMAKAKLWSSPHGQTPAATLYSAIQREINTKQNPSCAVP